MEIKGYSIRTDTDLTFDAAIEKVTASLKEQGFGVLTEIDVSATLKKKIDVDFPRYTILGACNPKLAHQTLQAEREIGLLLPCNVIVYEKEEGGVAVAAMNPAEAMSVVKNDAIAPIAGEVTDKLKKAISALEG
jgi:uncharacterized protein (DUF302 family)